MINHAALGPKDVERARRFYDAIFDILGCVNSRSRNGCSPRYGEIIFNFVTPTNWQRDKGRQWTTSLRAQSRKMVDEFHAVALRDIGRPVRAGPG